MISLAASLAVIFFQLLIVSDISDAWNIDGKIRIRIFKQSSQEFSEVPLEEGEHLLTEAEGFNRSLPLVLVIHGMAQGADSVFVNGVVDAFVERQIRNKYNILAVDMPELFENSLINNFYIGVLANCQPAGERIGEFLSRVISLGLVRAERVSLLGYSMGAQVAGYAARLVKELFGPVNYIIGLDPAGPGFHKIFGRAPQLTHVSHRDARVTHFYHTNSISCGTRDRVGTADFVFNNGGTQPGCFKDATIDCSHIRVPLLFIEAIANPQNFIARHCSTWNSFRNCDCNGYGTAAITFPPDESAHGIYYLRTHKKSPYGMGEAGSRCRRIIHPVSPYTDHDNIGIDPVLLGSKNPFKGKEDMLTARHHHRLADNVNIHIINGIKKIEDFRSKPEITEPQNEEEERITNRDAAGDKDCEKKADENIGSVEDLQSLNPKKGQD